MQSRFIKALFVSIILLFILVNGCTKQKIINEEKQLSEIQIIACNSADEGSTCDTKLEELKIITKEQCCQILNKCC